MHIRKNQEIFLREIQLMNIIYFIDFNWRGFDEIEGLQYHLRGGGKRLFHLIFFFFDVF